MTTDQTLEAAQRGKAVSREIFIARVRSDLRSIVQASDVKTMRKDAAEAVEAVAAECGEVER